MKQKKSPYGNININGGCGGPAIIYNNRDEDFLEEVEDGIKPIIRACIINKIDTFNSCEGHEYPDGKVDARNFDVVISSSCAEDWREYIEKIKTTHNVNLLCQIFELNNTIVINKEYNSPIRFKILILGDSVEEIDRATAVIGNSILNKEYPKCN